MIIHEEELLKLAEKVVKRYIIMGSIPLYEHEDFTMSIVEKFLQKKKKIEANYLGKANKQTYIIAILNRMCCELIRKEIKHWGNLPELQANNEKLSIEQTTQHIFIRDELQLLARTLILFGQEQYKIKVFLAFFFRLPVNSDDLKQYALKYNDYVNEIFKSNKTKPKAELYTIMALVIEIVEQKSIKPDAVRMWLMKRLNQIIVRLNGSETSKIARYDKESVENLFEQYCMEETYTDEHIS